LNTNLEFEKSLTILDNTLSSQRSLCIKIGLGYDYNKKTLNEYASHKSSQKKIEEKPKIYENILKISSCRNDNKKERNHNQKKTNFLLKKDKYEFRSVASSRRPFTTRYQNLFLGYCFSCNNFGHKAIDCKAYGRNDCMRNRSRMFHKNYKDYHMNRKTRGFHGFVDRNYNPFSPLHYNIECYK
jgi:hypothetical protein